MLESLYSLAVSPTVRKLGQSPSRAKSDRPDRERHAPLPMRNGLATFSRTFFEWNCQNLALLSSPQAFKSTFLPPGWSSCRHLKKQSQ